MAVVWALIHLLSALISTLIFLPAQMLTLYWFSVRSENTDIDVKNKINLPESSCRVLNLSVLSTAVMRRATQIIQDCKSEKKEQNSLKHF